MKQTLNRLTLAAFVASAIVTIASAQGPGFPPPPGEQGGQHRGPGGQGGPGGPGMRRPNGGPAILMMPEVREELKLTDEQVESLHEALPRPQSGQRLGRGEMEKVEATIKGILSEGQYRRYQQISLQMQGPGALVRPDIAQKLGLSEDQVEQIHSILEQNRPPMPPDGGPGQGGPGQGGPGGPGDGGPGGPGGPGQGGPGGPGGPGRPGGPENDAKRKEVDAKINAVLTSAQREKWKAMLGEPFRPRRPRD